MSTPRVMLVSNDVDVQTLFNYALQRAGYSVETTVSHEEALSKCDEETPSIIIAERFMHQPEDGLEFCRAFRAKSTLTHIPIIIGFHDGSETSTEEAYQKAFDAGANACFGRVSDISEVLHQVETLLVDPTTTNLWDEQSKRLHDRKTGKTSE